MHGSSWHSRRIATNPQGAKHLEFFADQDPETFFAPGTNAPKPMEGSAKAIWVWVKTPSSAPINTQIRPFKKTVQWRMVGFIPKNTNLFARLVGHLTHFRHLTTNMETLPSYLMCRSEHFPPCPGRRLSQRSKMIRHGQRYCCMHTSSYRLGLSRVIFKLIMDLFGVLI